MRWLSIVRFIKREFLPYNIIILLIFWRLGTQLGLQLRGRASDLNLSTFEVLFSEKPSGVKAVLLVQLPILSRGAFQSSRQKGVELLYRTRNFLMFANTTGFASARIWWMVQ